VLVSAAGPISNFVSAFIFGVIFQMLNRFVIEPSPLIADLYTLLITAIYINLILAIFNFIPLYPLDGSHILKGFLPRSMLSGYESVCRYSPFILLGVILLSTLVHIPILHYIIMPPTNYFFKMFSGL
jgi:Zn-dependent protease